MTKLDPHAAAALALRSAVSVCIANLCKDLEKAGKALERVPCMKVEGRAQVALAAKLRKQAERAGWVMAGNGK
jgi:hypothetical protein